MTKQLKILLVIILASLLLFLPKNNVYAENAVDCNNRYATLVNPVRSRDLWLDKTLKPLKDQYDLAKKYKVPVTWLLQYDTLADKELVDKIKQFDKDHELGIFLEVSSKYAYEARVIYPYLAEWFSPNAIFLSAYSQSDRRLLIDKLFNQFKEKFGYHPKSVGAWWIDSYSLNYMKDKYNINVAMIVADQKTTDNYGVWGQWWGAPYYPSKANILTPASTLANKQNVVIIQWALRDPLLAYGEGPTISNYSMQANDYIRQGKNTDYFLSLAQSYLSCTNKIGQITVGIETGSDSVVYFSELEKQYQAMVNIPGLNIVTMNGFAQIFSKIYPKFPEKGVIGNQDSQWIMTTAQRANSKHNEVINYQQGIAFSDYFLADKAPFLDRRLPLDINSKNTFFDQWFLIAFLVFGICAYFKKIFTVWISGTLFILAAFGLILRSYTQYGWNIFYGPTLDAVSLVQILIVCICFLLTFSLYSILDRKRITLLYLYFLPISFALDPLIRVFRYTFVSGIHYLGFAVDSLRFIGLSYKFSMEIKFINQDFPSYQAAALLRWDIYKAQFDPWVHLILYPLIHIIISFVLTYILLKMPVKIRYALFAIITILLCLHLVNIFQLDPQNLLKLE